MYIPDQSDQLWTDVTGNIGYQVHANASLFTFLGWCVGFNVETSLS